MKSNQAEQIECSLIDLAVESWRFVRVFNRAIEKLDAGEGHRFLSQLRYFRMKMEQALAAVDLKIVDVEGQQFDPGAAVTALNLGDFSSEDQLLVDQMVEPIIMGPSGLKRTGTVMLRKVSI